MITYALCIGAIVGALITYGIAALAASRTIGNLQMRELQARERAEDLAGQLDATRHRLQLVRLRAEHHEARAEAYLAELDALSVAGRPPEREVFAASVEASLAQLPVAEPERPKAVFPDQAPFGMAIYPRKEGQ